MKLSGSLDSIKASYKGSKGVNAILYERERKEKFYGDLKENNTVWRFDDNLQLVGMYGYVKNDRIRQLSFILLASDESLCPE